MWSLFCSIRLYTGLHFLSILLKKNQHGIAKKRKLFNYKYLNSAYCYKGRILQSIFFYSSHKSISSCSFFPDLLGPVCSFFNYVYSLVLEIPLLRFEVLPYKFWQFFLPRFNSEKRLIHFCATSIFSRICLHLMFVSTVHVRIHLKADSRVEWSNNFQMLFSP